MKRLFEKDRQILMEYLLREPYFNTYIIGDVENFGLDTETVQIYCEEEQDIRCIVMMYRGDFVVYSHDAVFDAKKVAEFIRNQITEENYCVSGKGDVIDRLYCELPDKKIRTTYFSHLKGFCPSSGQAPYPVVRITEQESHALRQLYLSIDEFHDKYVRYTDADMKTSFEGGRTYGILDENGVVIASASSTAESSYCAMVTNVCTSPACRNQGLAGIVMTKLIEELKKDCIENICLYYDNPLAGRVYKKIGFQEVGVYKTLR